MQKEKNNVKRTNVNNKKPAKVTSTEYWITNMSDRNVSLADLGITVPARASLNLLKPSYHFCIEQLEQSSSSGSIFKKSDYIKIRKVLPDANPVIPGIYAVKEMLVPNRYKVWSQLKIEEKYFEELDVSEDDAISTMVDSELDDNE